MNNPLALCELAARAPNISAGHMVKQASLSMSVFSYWIVHYPALMVGALIGSDSANRHWITHFALSVVKPES